MRLADLVGLFGLLHVSPAIVELAQVPRGPRYTSRPAPRHSCDLLTPEPVRKLIHASCWYAVESVSIRVTHFGSRRHRAASVSPLLELATCFPSFRALSPDVPSHC